MHKHHVLWFLPILLFFAMVRAAEPDPEFVHAEKTLQDAKVGTDGPSLIRLFRERTLMDGDHARLPDAVRRLGDEDFETREKAGDELLRAGRKALPYLRPAQRDKDPERARRAALCVQEIESGADLTQITAAAKLLTILRPQGATAALLAYLPGADNDELEETLLRALLVVGMKDGEPDPALLKAITAKEPLCRAAAGYVVGRAAPSRRASIRLLLADADVRVRVEAARALLYTADRVAVTTLIALLGEGPMPLAWRAQEILYRVAGEKAPTLALADEQPAQRARVADAWSGWWKEMGPTTKLAGINFDETLQGINVICEEAGGGRVWACRADGKPLWEIKNVLAWDAQLLPNGHVLIGEYSGGQVTERNLKGEILWSKKVDSQLSTVKRLPNGNTFITTFSEILEVDPKGTTLYSYKSAYGLVARAHRLRNGHLLFASGGDKIVELDAQFKEVRSIKVQGKGDSWMSVEPLPGDRYLVSPYGASNVTEIDAAGKVLWEIKTPQPMSAVRLPNGNTLVSCDREHAVYEYDRAGNKVWSLKLDSSVRCVRRY